MHILIAVDLLSDRHIERIAATLPKDATYERVHEDATDSVYAAALDRADVSIGWPKPGLLLESKVSLQQLPSIGFDRYLSIGLENKKNFTFCNARGIMTSAMAEHFAAMMLALARRLPKHIRDMTEKRWEPALPYQQLAGSTACIIGLGDIGSEIARICLNFNMRVVGVRRDVSKKHEFVKSLFSFENIHKAVAQADHVVVIFPAAPVYKKSIDAPVFAAMKPGAYFYNLARGALVDEQALITALTSGHLGGAGLDVFETEPLPEDSPLWMMENVVITPHIGGRYAHEEDRFCDLVIKNLNRFVRGEAPINQVDLSPPGKK